MSARRHAVTAFVLAVLAVVLWWLARDVVMGEAPLVDPPVEGMISRTVTNPWLLLASTLAAGLAMVFATQAVLKSAMRTTH